MGGPLLYMLEAYEDRQDAGCSTDPTPLVELLGKKLAGHESRGRDSSSPATWPDVSELALYGDHFALEVDPDHHAGLLSQRRPGVRMAGRHVWINPSPAIARHGASDATPAALPGTNLSEGRGTTTPLEVFSAPG